MISIAYDFDGTLVKIKTRQIGLLNSICKSFHIEIDQDRIWRNKRNGLTNVLALLEQDIEEELAIRIDQIWRNDIEKQFWLNMDREIPERLDELRELRKQKCKTYLISARRHPHNLAQQIDTLNWSGLFDEVICVSPSTKVVDKAFYLRTRGIALFIGDTEADFESAQIANVEFCAVSTGQRNKEFLRQIGIKNIDCEINELIKH